jgi:signal peptidase I
MLSTNLSAMSRLIVALSLVLLVCASANAAVSPVSSESFRETLKNQEFVLVNFYVRYCGYNHSAATLARSSFAHPRFRS